MKTNKERLALVARELRLMAAAAENSSEPRQLVSLIQGLQTAISLISLCMFTRQKKLIQGVAHDLDPVELKGVL